MLDMVRHKGMEFITMRAYFIIIYRIFAVMMSNVFGWSKNVDINCRFWTVLGFGAGLRQSNKRSSYTSDLGNQFDIPLRWSYLGFDPSKVDKINLMAVRCCRSSTPFSHQRTVCLP